MTLLDIVVGDIWHKHADAMIMPVDLAGRWIGRFFPEYESLTPYYSGALDEAKPLRDGEVVLAEDADPIAPNLQRIIFVAVADEGEITLAELLARALRFADGLCLRRVCLPVIRAIGQPGIYSYKDLVTETIRSVRDFSDQNPSCLQEIQIVLTEDLPWYK